ncbi:MAG: spermidine synthase [Planctomycetota bacterium]|jgi:spermidine synthase
MHSERKSDLVFFLSGAAALIYQVAWARLLARLTGSDSIGIALVLAVFMAGMGIGAWFFADRVRSAKSPATLYAVLSVIMGLWAAASPFLLSSLQPVGSIETRVAIAMLLLLVPTAIMGATFPLMGRLTIDADVSAGASTSKFYGANTLGAAAGALLGPFLIFPLVGLSRGLWIGAAFDIAAAGLAVLWLQTGRVQAEVKQPDAGSESNSLRTLALTLTLLFGASSLALEVLLTRLLITVTGASVFAFAIVLAVFLIGIGYGGRTATKYLSESGGAARLIYRCAIWIPVAGLLGLLFLRFQLGEQDLFGVLTNRMPKGASTPVVWASQAFFAGLALFPSAFGFGLALPACTELIVKARGNWSREKAMGRLYACNTAGATLGSLGAGFLLLPLLGPRLSLAIAFALTWLSAPLLGKYSTVRFSKLLAPSLLGIGLGWLALSPAPDSSASQTLYHRVGRDSTVSVIETQGATDPKREVRSLLVNGKVVATTAPVDLRLQRLLGSIPAHLHGQPKSALVIGLGTGMTAGALLDYPSLESLRIFEISTTVREAAQYFDRWNSSVLDDPRTEIEIADGRHALSLSNERFDIVTSDPIHPWTRGSSDLYAQEHFAHMAEHLAPNGIASQWLPLYQLATEDVKLIISTWCSAFEFTSAWLSAYDLVLVGSKVPQPMTATFMRGFPSGVDASLARAGIHSPLELAALFAAGDEHLRELSREFEPMLEDHPRLEFRAPLSYLSGYATEILAWAAELSPPAIPAQSQTRAREVRELLKQFLTELPNGLTVAAERYGQQLIALPPIR